MLAILLLPLTLLFPPAAPQDCDWSSSGSGGSGRGVTPVYLGCREGRVSWAYPHGALRVVLRLPTHSQFRACLRPEAPFGGAALYLEGVRSLSKLYTPSEASRSLVRCFQSNGGQVALYVEATGRAASRQVASFAYHLQPLPKGKPYDPSEECRPCTLKEMTHAFCTSELVVRGIVQRVEKIEDTDISEITIRVSKTLSELDRENEIETVKRETVKVEMAQHCEAQHGDGQVVVMAARKLGRLALICAPRASEWSRVVTEFADSAHCLLSE